MSVYEHLYDWQKNIIDTLQDKQSYGIWLDCGLGKTPVGLAFAERHKCTKVLIVTLNAKACETEDVEGSWLYWASKMNIHYNFMTKSTENFDVSNNELFIINYESLFLRKKDKKARVLLKENVENFIKSCKGHNVAILIDESHKIKDLQSQQTLAIFKIKQLLEKYSNSVFTYLLTGTPFTTGYVDLYAQLKMLGCEMTKTTFVDNFCIRGHRPGLLGWQQPIIGYKNVDEMFKLVHKYAITAESEMFVKLPKDIPIYYYTPMSSAFIAYMKEKDYPTNIIKNCIKFGVDYSKYVDLPHKKINNPFYRNIAYPELDWLAETSGSYWLRARQLSIGFQGNADKSRWFDKSRLNMLEKFLTENENNYVLFYNYTPELIEIYNICEKLGYNIDVYCGEAKSLVFYERYSHQSESEQLTNKKNVIIANFALGSTGLNWQKYNRMILFSLPIYKDYYQGIKRILRLGQKQTTFFYFFMSNNWLDKSMYQSLVDGTNYNSDMYAADLERIKMLNEGDNDDETN